VLFSRIRGFAVWRRNGATWSIQPWRRRGDDDGADDHRMMAVIITG
jgi:hypothetical protein